MLESICGDCLSVIPASLASDRRGALLIRTCATHGEQELLLEVDQSFFELQLRTQRLAPAGPLARTVSYPQGDFRIEHPAAAVVLEITDDCNETCSTCIAGSFSGAGNYRTPRELRAELKTVFQGVPPLVFISGGEPTIHPDLFEIVSDVYEMGAPHVVLITNGRRLADEPEFAQELKYRFPDIEVFLQFDTFDPSLLLELRGLDLSGVRRRAIANLASSELSTTLVAIVQRGSSLSSIGLTVNFAATMRNIRGVQFQPLRATGRHAETGAPDRAPSIGEVVRSLSQQVDFIRSGDIVPHPVGPGTLAVGYWDRQRWHAATDVVLIDGGASRFLEPPSNAVSDYFRVSIVCYLDVYNWRSDQVAFSPVQVVTDNHELIPLDLHYLLGDPSGSSVPVVLRRPAYLGLPE